MNYRLLGKRIKQERLNKRLTQEVLAEKANISVSFLGQIERGERKLSLETLIKLGEALGVSLDYLVKDYTSKSDPELDELIYILRNQSQQEIRMLADVARIIFKYCQADREP